MSTQQGDREDLALLTKYIAAHRRRGTTPHADTYRRYVTLLARVGMADRRAA
jgi:hypothetical protein